LSDSNIVVIDTDIYSALHTDPERAAKRGLPVAKWKKTLAGKHVLISFQTRAEVLTGVRASNWGEKRVNEAVAKLDTAQTIPADTDVISAFATLGAECKQAGHALWAKEHTGDRWIAACAIAKGVPLLACDGIYADAPGLECLGSGDE